jgi:hypothetical protein
MNRVSQQKSLIKAAFKLDSGNQLNTMNLLYGPMADNTDIVLLRIRL